MSIRDNQLRTECLRVAAPYLADPPESPKEMLSRTRKRLELVRDREIRVILRDPGTVPMPTGMWIRTAEFDVVWVDSRTSPMHQALITFHEFAHMIWNHQPTPLTSELDNRRVHQVAQDQPGLSPDKEAALMRCGGDFAHELREQQAEMTARLLLEACARGPARGGYGHFLRQG